MPTGVQIGLLAEEVEGLIPELVEYEGENIVGVKYDRLQIYLLKAIQDQQKMIVSQQQQLQTQSARLDEIEALLKTAQLTSSDD